MTPAEPTERSDRPSPNLFRRATAGRWWWIIVQWSIISGALLAWAYIAFRPVYVACSLLKLNRNPRTILAPAFQSDNSGDSLLETEVQLIGSSQVLQLA